MNAVDNLTDLRYDRAKADTYTIMSTYHNDVEEDVLVYKISNTMYRGLSLVSLTKILTEFLKPDQLPSQGIFSGSNVAVCQSVVFSGGSVLDSTAHIFMRKAEEDKEDKLAVYMIGDTTLEITKDDALELLEEIAKRLQ